MKTKSLIVALISGLTCPTDAFTWMDIKKSLDGMQADEKGRFTEQALFYKPSIREALLDIQRLGFACNRKSTISCSKSYHKSQFDELCKKNTKADECSMAKLCCWNGNSCKGAVDTAGNFGKTLTESDEFKSAMKNTEKPQNQVDMEIVQNQMRNAIGGSKTELDSQGVQGNGEAPEARSAFIGFMNNPSSLYSLFDAPAGMNYQRNGVLAKYTQCPLNVPFCNREQCVNAYGEEPTTSYECFSIPGCCFDSNLYLYRLSFGKGFMASTAVCHRAIKTPMFSFFSGQLVNFNSGLFMPSLMEAVSNKIIDFANTDSGHKLMMEFHGCPRGDGLGAATLRFNYQMAQIWPMYSYLRVKGKQVTEDLIDALSPYCGWPGITRAQCMLKGCCWSLTKNACRSPLDLTGHNEESVQSAALSILIRSGDDKAAQLAATGGRSFNIVRNTGPLPNGSSRISPMAMAGLGLAATANGNLVTQGYSLPPEKESGTIPGVGLTSPEKLEVLRGRRETGESGDTGKRSGGLLSSIFGGIKNNDSSSAPSNGFSSICENKLYQLMLPACQKMNAMKMKMEMMKNKMNLFRNAKSSSDKNGDSNNGARSLFNLFGNDPFGNAVSEVYTNSLDQNSLLMTKVADGLQGSPLSKFLMLQSMMGPKNGMNSGIYQEQQYSQAGPSTFNQNSYIDPSKEKTADEGGSYTSNSITGMYDKMTQNGRTDVEQCPSHTFADHSKMSSCLPPYAEGVNPTFERLGQDRMTCKAKGCCWDNDINKGVLMSQTVASRLCLWKIPLDGQRWGLPDLTPQMSDCCRQHPCRRMNEQSFVQGYNSINPTKPPTYQQPYQQLRNTYVPPQPQYVPPPTQSPTYYNQPQQQQYQPQYQPQYQQPLQQPVQQPQYQSPVVTQSVTQQFQPVQTPIQVAPPIQTAGQANTPRYVPPVQNSYIQPTMASTMVSTMAPTTPIPIVPYIPPSQPSVVQASASASVSGSFQKLGYPITYTQPTQPPVQQFVPLVPVAASATPMTRPYPLAMVNGPINGAKSGDIKLVSADVEHSDGSVPTQKPVVIPLKPGLTLGNTIPTEKTLVSDWTEWTQCSVFDQAVNCGPGTKTRKDRNFGTNETVKCFIACKWSAWKPIEKCSRPCGIGRTRVARKCPIQGQCPEGPSTRVTTCRIKKCPIIKR